MKSLVLVLVLFVASTYGWFFGPSNNNKAAYDTLRVTFGKFDKLPKTTQDARAKGWVLTKHCSDKNYFAGHRYVLKGDTAVMLLFGANGQVAGIQMGAPRSTVGVKRAPWVQEGDMYVMTAYFRDPGTICSSTQKKKAFGDRLLILNGAKGKTIEIPYKEEDLSGTNWVSGKCFPWMGQHYWYNISNNMDCQDFYPVFIMYNSNRLDGFGWNTNGNLPSTRYEHPTPNRLNFFFQSKTRPICLNTAGPLTTQHVYLSNPYTSLCLF